MGQQNKKIKKLKKRKGKDQKRLRNRFVKRKNRNGRHGNRLFFLMAQSQTGSFFFLQKVGGVTGFAQSFDLDPVAETRSDREQQLKFKKKKPKSMNRWIESEFKVNRDPPNSNR